MNQDRLTREEWLKFGGLSAVLLAVVLTVALARPLVFERAVPAVLGDFLRQAEALPQAPVVKPLPADALKSQPQDDSGGAPEASQPASSPADQHMGQPEGDAGESAHEGSGDLPANSLTSQAEGDAGESAHEGSGGLPANSLTSQPEGDAGESAHVHVVQRGETLTTIAQSYGVTVTAIQDLNQLPNPNRILAGESLRIPRP